MFAESFGRQDAVLAGGICGKSKRLLSVSCHLNALSAWKLLCEAVYLLWAVRNDRGDEILEQSSSLLCASLYVLMSAVDNTVSPHRLVFHWCWLWISFVQIWQMCADFSPLFIRCFYSLWLVIYTLTEIYSIYEHCPQLWLVIANILTSYCSS